MGFAQFYSRLDLLEAEAMSVGTSLLKRWFLGVMKFSPWLKALALTQLGDSVIMLKRNLGEAPASNKKPSESPAGPHTSSKQGA